jgi:hypothetical protein
MTLASALQKTASRLMGEFGGALTYRRVTSGTYNATTGTVNETATDYVLRGVLQDVNAREVNELVQAGDKRLFIAAADLVVVPSTADRIVIGAVLHQIISIQIIEQGNQSITYELVLRV